MLHARLRPQLAAAMAHAQVIKQDKKLKKPKIWLYRDKETNALKGDGTVSYEDPFSAASAVDWFSNKEWKGIWMGPAGGKGGRGAA